MSAFWKWRAREAHSHLMPAHKNFHHKQIQHVDAGDAEDKGGYDRERRGEADQACLLVWRQRSGSLQPEAEVLLGFRIGDSIESSRSLDANSLPEDAGISNKTIRPEVVNENDAETPIEDPARSLLVLFSEEHVRR